MDSCNSTSVLGRAGYAQGYVVSPTVPDFTDITAACVEATLGTTGNPFTTKELYQTGTA